MRWLPFFPFETHAFARSSTLGREYAEAVTDIELAGWISALRSDADSVVIHITHNCHVLGGVLGDGMAHMLHRFRHTQTKTQTHTRTQGDRESKRVRAVCC